jgi:peptidylprolyl isomerase
VDYTLTLADGTVYQTTVGGNPLELVLGNGKYLSSFEEAIEGMEVGESRTITIPAADAYGPYRDDLIFTVDRSQINDESDPEVGDHLQGMNSDGQFFDLVVVAVNGTNYNGRTKINLWRARI